MSVVLGSVEGSSSGLHSSIALVLLGPGQVHVVVSSWVKVLEFLSPVGEVVQSTGNFFRNNRDLNNSCVGNQSVIDWKSSSGVGRSIGHNSSVGGNVGLDNGSSVS